jgi:hypothetical protein
MMKGAPILYMGGVFKDLSRSTGSLMVRTTLITHRQLALVWTRSSLRDLFILRLRLADDYNALDKEG